MPFLRFPNELLYVIADSLDIKHLNRFSQVNHRLNFLLSPLVTNYVAQNKNALLPWAAQKNHVFLARLLLEQAADIDAKGDDGYTAFEWATKKLNEQMTRLLLEEGAEFTDEAGKTALHDSARSDNVPLVDLLVKYGVPINACDEDGETALHFAANLGFAKTTNALLELGADVEAIDNRGRTALHCAVMSGYDCELVVQTLLAKGADIDARDFQGRTALHCAVMGGYGREEVIQLLLQKGADLTKRDNDDQTVLHKAAVAGKELVVKLLLAWGADFTAIDGQGRTVLHTMAYSGYRPVGWIPGGWAGWKNTIQILLDSGVDMSVKDEGGYTAFDAALQKGCDFMATILKNYSVDFLENTEDGDEDLLLQLDWVDVP